MEYKGIQNDISKDWITGEIKFEYLVKSPVSPEEIQQMKGKELRIKVTAWKNKRSLDANAYYWKLITGLANKLQISKPYLHNHLLRLYGYPELIDDKLIYVVVPDDNAGSRMADEALTYHIKPTSQVKEGVDGTTYRTYIMLRGSSTYNTEEMSNLIDGLVQECKEQGIETLPPEEFARMMEMYEQNRREHEMCSFERGGE